MCGRGVREKNEKELQLGQGKGNFFLQNGVVLDLGEPGQNRFNRSGSRFWRSNRRFPVFGLFFHFSGFFREPDWIRYRSLVEPVEPTGPVFKTMEIFNGESLNPSFNIVSL